ncbi:MAG TPA: hypothetical protein VGW40_10795 [Allosphingosinicella sp.]|nr:hypothetical protein [Allosphingosinicella sp.]
MKKMIILSAILASGAGWAQTPTSGGTSTETALDPNEMVCQAVVRTESRLARARVCMTRAQWAEQRRLTRQSTERQQQTRVERQF